MLGLCCYMLLFFAVASTTETWTCTFITLADTATFYMSSWHHYFIKSSVPGSWLDVKGLLPLQEKKEKKKYRQFSFSDSRLYCLVSGTELKGWETRKVLRVCVFFNPYTGSTITRYTKTQTSCKANKKLISKYAIVQLKDEF